MVSVDAWPRRRRKTSMETPLLKLDGVGVAELVDADPGAGGRAVFLPVRY